MSAVDYRQQQRTRYAQQLRTALEETGTSVYRLARVLNQAQPESARSNLQRYLAGKVLPGIESRAELAEALGRPELRSIPEDDEEDDQVAFADVLQRMFDQAVDRALEQRLRKVEA